MMHKTISKKNFFPILIFTVYLLIGIRIFKDYGITVDDPIERDTSLSVFNSLFPYTCTEEDNSETCPKKEDMNTYWDKNHGTFLQQPTALAEYLKHYRMDLRTVFWIRHLWTFVNVFISQIFFFFLLKKRFNSASAGIFGILAFIFSPRLFGNSFYDIKDMLFYAWFVISLFFLGELFENPCWLTALLLGIVSAAAANERIIGGIIPALGILFLLQDAITKKYSWKTIFTCLLILFSSVSLTWILITPVSWHNPFQQLWDVIHESSNFIRLKDYKNLYMGELVSASKLPWHYLPVWILISTPIFYSGLAIWGSVCSVYTICRKKLIPSKNQQLDISMLLILILSLGYVILRRPILYDSWRHFFFLYAEILYFSVYAFDRLFKRKSTIIRLLLSIFCVISFAATGSWMVKNHPYEGVYFNPFFRSYGLNHFDRDYWMLSTKECLEFITKNTEDARITIWDDGADIQNLLYSLSPQERSRISSINYGAGGEPAAFLINNNHTSKDPAMAYPFYKLIHEIKVDQIPVAGIFERDDTDKIESSDAAGRISSNINEDKTNLIDDSENTTGWSTGRPQKEGDYLEIFLKRTYHLYGITSFWEGHSGEYAHSLAIDFSNDGGKTWQPTEMITSERTDFAFKPVQANTLRLRLTADDSHSWYVSNLWLYANENLSYQ